jgi:hypothetical protein
LGKSQDRGFGDEFVSTLEAQAKSFGISPARARDELVMWLALA